MMETVCQLLLDPLFLGIQLLTPRLCVAFLFLAVATQLSVCFLLLEWQESFLQLVASLLPSAIVCLLLLWSDALIEAAQRSKGLFWCAVLEGCSPSWWEDMETGRGGVVVGGGSWLVTFYQFSRNRTEGRNRL